MDNVDFHLHVPKHLDDAITAWAERHGQSKASVMRRAVEFALGLAQHPEFANTGGTK